jgi:cell division protein FtsB
MIAQEKHSFVRLIRVVRATMWLLILVLVTMGIFGKRGLLDLQRMQSENIRLVKEIGEAHRNKEVLTHQIVAIQRDPQMQEQMIRKILGYIKADETVIDF